MNLQIVPPSCYYFAFSIDVTATLEMYCDGGNDFMLQKLDALRDRMYAGYCVEVKGASGAVEAIAVRTNCYHPTCYDLYGRIPTEWRDYSQSPRLRARFSPQLIKPLAEDGRYHQLLRSGLDDDQVLRILDGQEDAPDTDNRSETDSQTGQTFLANMPGCDEPEDDIFMPVLRIEYVLSNVLEVFDPSQLWEDRDLFQ
ncbi:uncharacterized protein BT62DRAFT_1074655, partial [Guyanagaster necrorhizus]